MLRLKRESVSAKVTENLRLKAQEAGPGGRLPSVRDLRSELGISHAPLEVALGQLEREGVIERRHGLGIFVKERIAVSRCAVIFDAATMYGGTASPFWFLLLRTIMEEGQKRGWEPVLHMVLAGEYSTDEKDVESGAVPMGLVNELLDGHVGGVIALSLTQPIFNYLDSFDIPITSFAGYSRRRVQFDNEKFLRTALELVRAEGCTKVCMQQGGMSTPEEAASVAAEYGLQIWRTWASYPPSPATIFKQHDAIRIGYEMASEMEADAIREAPIVSFDDMGSLGMLMGFRARGMEPGRDFQLITHSNKGSSILLGWHKDIVRIVYDPKVIAVRLFEMLDGQISGSMPAHAFQADPSPLSPEPFDWATSVPFEVLNRQP